MYVENMVYHFNVGHFSFLNYCLISIGQNILVHPQCYIYICAFPRCEVTQFMSFSVAFCKVGVGICYDIRFAELAQIYAKKGENY